MEFPVEVLAAEVGGTLVAGDGRKLVSGVATLEEAGPDDLSFYATAKYRELFDATRAGAVLVTPEIDSGPQGVALIQVENPSYALAMLARLAVKAMRAFEPGVQKGAHVSEQARVDPGASVKAGAVIEAGAVVGSGSEVGACAVVGRGARLGEDCILHSNVSVRDGCVLGNRVIVHSGAVVGSDGFGYEFIGGKQEKVPQIGIVVVEDDVEIGANACIDRARFGKTIIGEGTKIDNLVQVAHNVRTGKHCIIVAQAGIAGSSRLGDYVTIAAQAGINGHISIADRVTIAGQSGVPKNIDRPGGVYWGLPAKPFKQELRLWKALGELHETTKLVKQLREEVDALKGER